jgi:hypothetical protein
MQLQQARCSAQRRELELSHVGRRAKGNCNKLVALRRAGSSRCPTWDGVSEKPNNATSAGARIRRACGMSCLREHREFTLTHDYGVAVQSRTKL